MKVMTVAVISAVQSKHVCSRAKYSSLSRDTESALPVVQKKSRNAVNAERAACFIKISSFLSQF